MSDQKQKLLVIAAKNGHENAVEALLKKAADPTKPDENENRPFHCAVRYGHENIVKMFLSHKPSCVDCKAEEGETALHIAASYGREAILELLLPLIDVNALTDAGSTPLHCAASGRSKITVERLLAEGANIHAENHYGLTPLDIADREGNKDIIEALLTHLATVYSPTVAE